MNQNIEIRHLLDRLPIRVIVGSMISVSRNCKLDVLVFRSKGANVRKRIVVGYDTEDLDEGTC